MHLQMMDKRRFFAAGKLFTGLILALLVVIPLLAGCSTGTSATLKVVTSTSLLADIVKQVGGDRVQVTNLVPPTNHPGSYDSRPGDIQSVYLADAFLLHGWPGEGYADKLIEAADNPNLKVIKVNVDGNWMIPEVQSQAAGKVADILAQLDTQNASFYQASAKTYQQKVLAKENEIKDRFRQANVSQVNIIASDRQADFLQWAGFNVVATFSATDMDKPQVVAQLVDQGRKAGAKLVVNNLQDGADAGKAIAGTLNARNVTLSNFPGGLDDAGTWQAAIDRNVEILLGSLSTQAK